MEKTEETFNDEINLLDYWRVIVKHKKLIIWIVEIVVIATAIVSLIMTPIYESKAVIMPVSASAKEPGLSAMLAVQFGIAPPASPAASEIVNLLKSNIIREKIINRYNLMPLLLEKKNLKDKTQNEILWEAMRTLEKMMMIKYVQKDNIIELSVQYKNPEKAADMVNYTLKELNEYMCSEAKRVADTNRRYLESQVDKVSDPYVKAKIYGLIAQQIETSMLAEAKENFAFKVLDPPKVPDKRVKPKRTQMVLISFVVALFASVFMAFFKEYVEKVRTKV